MPDGNELDIKKVIEQGTQRVTLKDLADRGHDHVKVLDEEAVHAMITQAVDRVVSNQTSEEREKLLAESRKELDRLMREQRDMRSRAQLLESNKNELVERVERLQRELQLKADLEEETLHRRVNEGLASLKSQVDELRRRAQSAAQDLEGARAEAERLRDEQARARREAEELKTQVESNKGTREAALAEVEELQKENARLAEDRDRVEKEGEAALAKVTALEKDLFDHLSKERGAEKARTELVGQILKLQSKADGRQQELDTVRAEIAGQKSESDRLRQDLEKGRSEAEQSRVERSQLEGRLSEERVGREAAQREVERIRKDLARASEDAARLGKGLEADRAERAELEGKLDALRGELEKVASEAERQRSRAAAALEGSEQHRLDIARLREQLGAAEVAGLAARGEVERLRSDVESARNDAQKARLEAERLSAERAALEQESRAKRADVERLEAEVAERRKSGEAAAAGEATLRARASELEARLAERTKEAETARAELEAARHETAYLQGQLGRQRKEQEVEREQTAIITADLKEIEECQKAERDEVERLKSEWGRLKENEARLAVDLEVARNEVKSLQELLGREQETARVVQNHASALQARLLEFQTRSESVEKDLQSHRLENARLQERLAGMESLLESANRSSTAAEAAAVQSREATAKLQETLADRLKPRERKLETSLEGGAAYDGMALLEGFVRKIRLKEHFQKFLPVQERPGRPHPSEMMVEVVKAIVAGEPVKGEDGKLPPLEIIGPSNAPDPESLRQFLGGLSPQAVRSLAGVHHALRLHLTPLPKKPYALVLDVVAIELGKPGRSYRPLLCFDGATGEFWSGQFRSNRAPDPNELSDFVKSCVARVPAPFARDRIRFRMDAEFFNEGVIRLLESKRVSYVIAAPDSPELRKLAGKCAFSGLSTGWEVGEFSQRLHPIRRTQGRFVVLRRRHSKAAEEAGKGTFKDERHVYHVFATDRRGTPWRSFEVYAARPGSVEKARALLSEFSTSPLLGRSRRSVAALFQAHLFASDLVQWFRRGCLPEGEKAKELGELRTGLLLTPSAPGIRSLVVLPKRDPRRRLFARVARLTGRLRTARPFHFKP